SLSLSFPTSLTFLSFFFPRPPIPTLFPYTTLFRSVCVQPEPAPGSRDDERGTDDTSDSDSDSDSSTSTAPTTTHAVPTTTSTPTDRKSTRLNSSHVKISYAVFCLKKKKHIFYYT